MRILLIATAMLLCLAPTSQAILIGTDPAGDSINNIAGGQNVSPTVTADRTDILAVDIEESGAVLNMKMLIGTAPAGTSGYMYRIIVEAGGATYFTCWNTQWIGGQAEEENVLGCSRFSDGTQVGPDLKADGVAVGGQDITWPVGKGEIGGAGLADIQSVRAETWFRGVSTCCAGSTGASSYLWNSADAGPDSGVWLVPVQAPDEPVGEIAAPISFVLVADALNITGHNVTFPVTIVAANVTAPFNVTLTADAPANINVTFPANVTITPGMPNATFEVHAVANFTGNETASFALTATSGNHTSSLTFVLTGDAQGLDDVDVIGGAPSQKSPAAPWLVVLLGTALLAHLRRRAHR